MTSTDSAVTASAASGNFSASTPSPMTKTSSARLTAQLLNGSGLTLTAARVPALVRWPPAASVPPVIAMIACSHGDASPSVVTATSAPPSGRTTRVDGVPQRVDPRHLVGDELDGVEHQRGADDPGVVEERELRRQAHQVEPRGQSEHGDGRVEVDAGGQREGQRASRRGQQFHRLCLAAWPIGPCAMSASSRARTSSIRRSRSSSVSPAVGTGAPIRTDILTGRTMALPRRIASRPPVTATGRIGACALMAMMKPPFLKGKSSSVRLRVPSGKMRNELPCADRGRGHVDRGQRLVAAAALDRHEPAGLHHHAEDRQLAQFGLEQDVQPAMQRPVQDRRVDVALVVGAEDDGVVRRARARGRRPGSGCRPRSSASQTPACASS